MEDKTTSKNAHLDVGGIFWGLLLIILGGLFVLSNLGYVSLRWSEVWRLWPLLIIVAGVSILAVKHVIWKFISLVLVLCSLALIVWALLGGMPTAFGDVVRSELSLVKQTNSVEKASIIINGGAGSLNIGSADQKEIVRSTIESNISKVVSGDYIDGNTEFITLTMDTPASNNWFRLGSIKNDWNINLSRNIPMSIDINAGAVSSNIDLSMVRITSAAINLGASSLDLKLGGIEKETSVKLKSGASSITLRVPKNTGVAVNVESGLGSNNMSGLDKVGDNIYESTDYKNSANRINIEAKTGASSLTLVRY